MKVKKWTALLLALLLATALPPAWALALGEIDLTRPVTLTVQYECGGRAAAGVDFSLYRAAEVSAAGEFTLTGDFGDYPVSLEDRSAQGWQDLAVTLAGYAQRDKLTPLETGRTDKDGTLTFPSGDGALEPGLYLVLGGQYTSGDSVYTAEPFLISLPDGDETGSQWRYDVTAAPKYTVRDTGGSSLDDTVSRRVLKVWDDEGGEDSRPDSVTVELLRNGRVYDTVTLDGASNWSHTWSGLSPSSQWTVVEREVLGYTVSVSQAGATFVVTNTSDENDLDTPGRPDDPDTPDGPNNPDDPNNPDNPDNPSNPGNPDHPDNPNNPDDPDTPDNHDNPDNPKLPQTGVLWWPVPVLLAAGLVLIIVGLVRRRRDNEE